MKNPFQKFEMSHRQTLTNIYPSPTTHTCAVAVMLLASVSADSSSSVAPVSPGCAGAAVASSALGCAAAAAGVAAAAADAGASASRAKMDSVSILASAARVSGTAAMFVSTKWYKNNVEENKRLLTRGAHGNAAERLLGDHFEHVGRIHGVRCILGGELQKGLMNTTSPGILRQVMGNPKTAMYIQKAAMKNQTTAMKNQTHAM